MTDGFLYGISVAKIEEDVARLEKDLEASLKFDRLNEDSLFKEVIIDGMLDADMNALALELVKPNVDSEQVLKDLEVLKSFKQLLVKREGNTEKLKASLADSRTLLREVMRNKD